MLKDFFFKKNPFYSNDMLNLSFDVEPTLSLSSYSFWKNNKKLVVDIGLSNSFGK
jgi:hypothetical protein